MRFPMHHLNSSCFGALCLYACHTSAWNALKGHCNHSEEMSTFELFCISFSACRAIDVVGRHVKAVHDSSG